ncbi:hypothetical protein BVRB_6g143560 [Beta vulgaris subsp. vulgaris]|nr:hypothetical protein BVRB_6g143560 [Beta vulgaris subsp. vulgaris]
MKTDDSCGMVVAWPITFAGKSIVAPENWWSKNKGRGFTIRLLGIRFIRDVPFSMVLLHCNYYMPSRALKSELRTQK